MGGARWPDSGDGSQGCRLQEGSPGGNQASVTKNGTWVNHTLSWCPTANRRCDNVLLPQSLSFVEVYIQLDDSEKKNAVSCKSVPLAFTFSITHLGTGYFQQIPKSKLYLWAALVFRPWGRESKLLWVFPLQTLSALLDRPSSGAEEVSNFSFLWPDI